MIYQIDQDDVMNFSQERHPIETPYRYCATALQVEEVLNPFVIFLVHVMELVP
jgi:hypothetical protein